MPSPPLLFLSPSPLTTATALSPRSLTDKKPRRRQRHVTPSFHLRTPSPHLPNSGEGSIPSYVPSVEFPSLRLFTRTWNPAVTHNPPHAGLLIIPGLQWHSGWFSRIAQSLASISVRVVAIDPLSTGRSDDIEATRAYIPSPLPTADIVSILNSQFPSCTPTFILAESSGVHAALTLALRHRDEIDIKGWILCGPALKLAPGLLPPPLVVFMMRRFFSKLLPKAAAPQNISGDTFDLAFGDGGVCAAVAKNDPYVLFNVPVPLATVRSSLDAMDEIEKALQNEELYLEHVLVLHNRRDVRTAYEGSQNLVDRVKGKEAKVVDPGGHAHQLFQESNDVTLQVVREIVDFVERLK